MTDTFGENIKLSDGKQKDVHEFHYKFVESLNEALNHHYLALEKKKSILKESPISKHNSSDVEMKEENDEVEDIKMEIELQDESLEIS